MKKMVILATVFLFGCFSVYTQEKQFILQKDKKGNLRVEYDTSYHDAGIRISEPATKYLDSVPVLLERGGTVAVTKKYKEFVSMVGLFRYRDREVIDESITLIDNFIFCTGRIVTYSNDDKSATFLVFFIISFFFFILYNLGIIEGFSWWISLVFFIIFTFPIFDGQLFDWLIRSVLFLTFVSYVMTGDKAKVRRYEVFSILYYGTMISFLFLLFI